MGKPWVICRSLCLSNHLRSHIHLRHNWILLSSLSGDGIAMYRNQGSSFSSFVKMLPLFRDRKAKPKRKSQGSIFMSPRVLCYLASNQELPIAQLLRFGIALQLSCYKVSIRGCSGSSQRTRQWTICNVHGKLSHWVTIMCLEKNKNEGQTFANKSFSANIQLWWTWPMILVSTSAQFCRFNTHEIHLFCICYSLPGKGCREDT